MDAPGKTQLRILLLEDEPTDAELVQSALREAGLSFVSLRVDKRETFVKALGEFKPDIVLSDFKLPAFDGASAIRIVREHYPNIPVVMVTGAVGDERAIELLRLGARDYVLKDHLARVAPAVKRALSEERSIRARKAAEEALIEGEAELRALVERSPVAMLVDVGVEADEKIVMMNRKFTELFGYTMEDVPDIRHWWLLAYPDEKYRGELRAEWTGRVEDAVQRRGEIEPMEAMVTCKDGSRRYIRASFASIGNRNIITFEDLTERKGLEDALKESAERYHTIMQTANDAIISIRPDGVIHLWNHKAQEMFGYSAEEAIGQEMHPLITPANYRERQDEGLRQFVKTGKGPIVGTMHELTALRKDGTEFPVELSVSAMSIRGEWHATGIIRDITERKKAQARIQKLSRLYATLGETNQIIVRTTNREELFVRVCRSAVTSGKFVLAWVGLVDEATHLVKPVCHEGAEQGFLASITVSCDDVPEGKGPTGTAIRENRASFVNDYATDKRMLPWREAALKRGYRGAAAVPLRFQGRPLGALTLYADEVNFFDPEQLDLLEEMATDISFALDGFEREAQRRKAEEERGLALQKLRKALENSVGVAASVSEVRDPYTSGHQRRVSQLAVAIAREMGLSANQIDGIHFGGLIHDIGKIGVPAEILSKPSKLTQLEMKLIQTHPQAGSDVIKGVEFPWPVAQIILQHHERLNGSGYPAGLKGDEIIVEARIIAVADSVEAMWSHRPYRPGLGMDAALAEIARTRGTLYDKQAVDACLHLIREKGFAFTPD